MFKFLILLSASVLSHNVTCCFNAYEKLTELYVNEQNITSSIYNFDGNYRFTFKEPNSSNNIIAMKGYNRNEMLIATLRMSCVSTNSNSIWNLRTEADKSWKIVKNVVYSPITDLISKDYYIYNYTKTLFNPDIVPDIMPTGNFVLRYNFNSSVCLSSAKHLRIFKGGLRPERWFAIRHKL